MFISLTVCVARPSDARHVLTPLRANRFFWWSEPQVQIRGGGATRSRVTPPLHPCDSTLFALPMLLLLLLLLWLLSCMTVFHCCLHLFFCSVDFLTFLFACIACPVIVNVSWDAFISYCALSDILIFMSWIFAACPVQSSWVFHVTPSLARVIANNFVQHYYCFITFNFVLILICRHWNMRTRVHVQFI